MASSVVSHGRRKGSLRSTPDRQQTAVKPGQVAMVAASEWARICGNVTKEEKKIVNDREELHERSKAIVKNWENTIEGQRLKKLQAHKIREEKEEAEKVKIDIEEAKFQAERRKEAIEKAKTLLYYQTDRVKQFHGALLLSEVLRERDQQVEYKKRRETALQGQDKHYLEVQARERENGVRADLEAAGRRAKERNMVAKFQLAQAAQKATMRAEEREAALKEQAGLDQEVAIFHQRQKELEAQQRQAQLEYRKALDNVFEQKREREKKKKKKALKEEEEIKVFDNAKKRMTTMRKAKEEELFREFQTHQQHMCQLLQTQRQEASSNEDKRIAQAVAEQNAKREAEERAKEERFAERTRDIYSHMRTQLAEEEQKKREQKALDQELLRQRIIQDQKFHSQQMEKQGKAKKEALDRQDFHRLQMKEKVARKDATRNDERDFINENQALLKVEEDQFQQYAHGVIERAAERGGHTQPLLKAARPGAGRGHGRVFSGKGGMRPSYQTTDSTAKELPSYLPKPTQPSNTQKRMGFTW